MKIVLYIHCLRGGGAERWAANLLAWWAEHEHSVTLITDLEPSTDFYTIPSTIRRVVLPLTFLHKVHPAIGRIVALRRVLKVVVPDVVVAAEPRANVSIGISCFGLAGVTLIGCEQNVPESDGMGPFWSFLRRLCYGLLDAVVGVSGEIANWLLQHTTARRTLSIVNPLRFPLPFQQPVVAVESVVSPGPHVIIAVGRLVPQKGFDILLRAFARVPMRQGWHLVILGDGPLRADLVALVTALGLADVVHLPGRVGNLGDFYERGDLYVMSSRFEGFPNTLMEAMSYGLPAVSFDCDTGPRDIIRPGIDGELVPPQDEAALSASLFRLMADAPLRARLGSRAVEARERFSLERIAKMWDELIADLRPAGTGVREGAHTMQEK
jgi:glycosyltransferase involved in cell wall biosynthesis